MKEKNKGGRPTRYTPELLEKAATYIHKYMEDGSVIPSASGLALFLGINRSTLYEWSNNPEKQEFSDILSEIHFRQEQLLINNGLTGDFNSAITKLALGKHGYHDKVDSSLTGADGGAIRTNNHITIEVIE
jgi:hypothetical protein